MVTGGVGVTDGHIRHLLLCGHSEDVVFECVVAAAVGAGVQRLHTVERLLENCRSDNSQSDNH